MNAVRQRDWRLEIFDVVASTSDVCRERAAAGEPEGLAVLALRQSQARGSRGRDWQSPAGNLALSVLLRPSERARDAAQWSLLAGIALADALADHLDPGALRLKWPNDVLLHGRKLAGILVDSGATPTGDTEFLVIGIGVNLSVAPHVPGRTVACLAEFAIPPAPEPFARAVLARLSHWRAARERDGFAAIRAAWLARAGTLGTETTLRLGERHVTGRFAGLAENGSLRIETEGCIHTFATGEVLA